MFPCFAQVSFYLFVIEDHFLRHPSLHVRLGGTCVYISSFPPASSSGNVFATQAPFLVVIVLCYFCSLAFEDALPILPECLCGLVFWFGLSPYHPLCIILKLREALLLAL